MNYVAASGAVLSSRGTYVIQTLNDAVVWGHAVVNVALFIEAYMHAHADHLHDAWMFQGEAKEVFVTCLEPYF